MNRSCEARRRVALEMTERNAVADVAADTSIDGEVLAQEISVRLEAARAAARTGGNILQDWAGRFTAKEKSRSNLVTEADFASQRAIFDHLHGLFPDDRFLGEEETDPVGGDGPWRWVVDPLDGTGNYVHGFPYYAVSIGLTRTDGDCVAGVIHDPTRDETFDAVAGQGARLNGQRLEVTDTDCLAGAFCVASLPVANDGKNAAVKRFLEVIPHAQTVQRTGSAALNLCYVAAGRIDAFWSTSLKPWDMAAGVVIVREAGGLVTCCDGAEFDLFTSDLLATNGTSLHQELGQRLTAIT